MNVDNGEPYEDQLTLADIYSVDSIVGIYNQGFGDKDFGILINDCFSKLDPDELSGISLYSKTIAEACMNLTSKAAREESSLTTAQVLNSIISDPTYKTSQFSDLMGYIDVLSKSDFSKQDIIFKLRQIAHIYNICALMLQSLV